jgi:hypothetical protein
MARYKDRPKAGERPHLMTAGIAKLVRNYQTMKELALFCHVFSNIIEDGLLFKKSFPNFAGHNKITIGRR